MRDMSGIQRRFTKTTDRSEERRVVLVPLTKTTDRWKSVV